MQSPVQGGIIIFTSCHPIFSIKYFARKSMICAHTIFSSKEHDWRTYHILLERAWFSHIPYFARKSMIRAPHTRQPFFMCYDSYTILLSIISFRRKLFPLAGNYFLLQEIIPFDRKLFPLAGNYFLWQELISFVRKLFCLTGNYFL